MKSFDYQTNKANSVHPYLFVESVSELINFVEKVFKGSLSYKLDNPTGRIIRAEMKIGNTIIMAEETSGEFSLSPSSLYIYVWDCDIIYENALEYGCESIVPLTNMKHLSERYGAIKDKNKNIWWIATQVENLTYKEQKIRLKIKKESEVEHRGL